MGVGDVRSAIAIPVAPHAAAVASFKPPAFYPTPERATLACG